METAKSIVIIFILFATCNAYRILGVFPFNGKSHNIVLESVMKTLASHGHQVDVVTHFPQKKVVENYTDVISLEGTLESIINNYTIELVSQVRDELVEFVAGPYGNRLCDFMGVKDFQNLIKNPPQDPPYDLVMTEVSFYD